MNAQFNLAVSYEVGSGVAVDEKKAFRYFKLAADQGDAEAQFSVGSYYALGIGMVVNKMEAVKYYAMAAQQGHKESTKALSYCNI